MDDQNNTQLVIPENLSVLYTDGAGVGTNSVGLTIEFAQHKGNNPNLLFVVSRIGMSLDNAEILIEALRNSIEKQKKLNLQKK